MFRRFVLAALVVGLIAGPALAFADPPDESRPALAAFDASALEVAASAVVADSAPATAPAPVAAVPAAPAPAPFVHPTAEEFLARGALSSLLVGISVRVMRGLFPEQLAPTPSTLTSRRLVIGVCLVSGVALGLAGLAPAVAAGWPGPVMGGLGSGGLAYVTAGATGAKARLEKPDQPPTV